MGKQIQMRIQKNFWRQNNSGFLRLFRSARRERWSMLAFGEQFDNNTGLLKRKEVPRK